MLDDLEYGRRVNDHKVDVHTCCGVTARGRSIGRLSQGANGVKSAARHTDNSHVVIHLNRSVDVRCFVVNIAGDVILEVAVDSRVAEQDSALIRDFLIVHRRLCGGQQTGDVIAIGKRTRDGSACTCGIFSKSVQCVIAKAFYPLLLIVSYEFSISFQPWWVAPASW